MTWLPHVAIPGQAITVAVQRATIAVNLHAGGCSRAFVHDIRHPIVVAVQYLTQKYRLHEGGHLGASHQLIGIGGESAIANLGKRVIVMPRRAALGEHRNEHQLATVARLGHLAGLEIVHEPADLGAALAGNRVHAVGASSAATNPELIAAVRQFAGLEAL